MGIKVPFNKPCPEGKELEYIAKAISNSHISGDGEFSKYCHAFLEQQLGVTKALLTTSGTHALEMAAILLEFEPNSEVIVPSFTFVSSANAFMLHGAKPVFIDIRADTLNIDETQLEEIITPHTKAIVPVHYAGVGCEMNAILDTAKKNGISVIEDNAHGLFGRYKNKYLGTFGCMSALSFHETKNFICGEGGAILINDRKYVSRAEIIREKGTNRSQHFRGEVNKYTWLDVGSSYLLSDILAAFLYGQLEIKDHILQLRKKVWNYYYNNLKDWAREHHVRLPVVPEYCEQSYSMFYMIMPSSKDRDNMIVYLRSRGIESVFHYLPLHLSKMGAMLGNKKGDFPVTEDISVRLIRLPFYNKITEPEQEIVVQYILKFY